MNVSQNSKFSIRFSTLNSDFSEMKNFFLVGSFLDQRFTSLERRKKVTARSEQFSDRGIKKYSIDPTLRIVFQ